MRNDLTDAVDQANEANAKIIKRVFSSKDGKKALQILRDHFQVDIPSAPLCGFDTNQTFYRDGNKAPFTLIQQVLDGMWDKSASDEEDDDES
jgi:hypothetical protein